MKIVESHNLYIDSTKLVAIRHKGRKNPSKVVRDLLMYFFQPEYLAQHSATGLKSQKRGLPTEIIQPIRGMLKTISGSKYEIQIQVANSRFSQ